MTYVIFGQMIWVWYPVTYIISKSDCVLKMIKNVWQTRIPLVIIYIYSHIYYNCDARTTILDYCGKVCIKA